MKNLEEQEDTVLGVRVSVLNEHEICKMDELVEKFVSSKELEEKMVALRGLKPDEMMEFERIAQIRSATSDDLALIASFRDLANNGDVRNMPRSDSEAYWHRATGDFECQSEQKKSSHATSESGYWEEVTAINDPYSAPPRPSTGNAAPMKPRQA